MALTPFNVEGFTGLNLSADPEEVGLGGAIDLLNCDLDRPGIVRSRDGYAKVTGSAGATRYDSVFPVAGAASITAVASLPGTMADDTSHGTIAWSPATLPATAAMTLSTTSHYLKATNFGFSVPSTATITGIVATVTRSISSIGAVADESVKLVKAGSVVGTDHSASAGWAPTPGDTVSFGSSSDLWGTTWTPTNVNASTFGVVLSCLCLSSSKTATVSAIAITVYYQALGSVLVAGASASRLDVIATDGTVSATVATASDTRSSMVSFGSPTTSATYIANSGTTIRKLVATTFSTPSGMPKAKYVGLMTPDNRLVAANIAVIPTSAGSTASTSLVHFSDAGAPETWSANNYVYLTPGDNEDIQGVVTWRNQTFIFKSSAFSVFYGNSTDNAGAPVFNYRAVTGAGMAAPQCGCAGPDGVYFLDRRGIYFTDGGPPVRVSIPVDPLFIGGSVSFFVPGVVNPSAFAQATMAWYGGRLYVGLPLGVATVNSHTLVFDPQTRNWMVWDIPMGAMVSSTSQPATLYFVYASGTNDIGQWTANSYTTDAGTVITSRYKSGFSDLGGPGVEKTVRQTELNGQGIVSLGWARDFGALTTTSTANVTLGAAQTTARGLHRLSQNGEQLGYQIASVTGGAWALNRITPMLRPFRQPGDKTS